MTRAERCIYVEPSANGILIVFTMCLFERVIFPVDILFNAHLHILEMIIHSSVILVTSRA